MKNKMLIYCFYKKCDEYPLKLITYPHKQHEEMTCCTSVSSDFLYVQYLLLSHNL